MRGGRVGGRCVVWSEWWGFVWREVRTGRGWDGRGREIRGKGMYRYICLRGEGYVCVCGEKMG